MKKLLAIFIALPIFMAKALPNYEQELCSKNGGTWYSSGNVCHYWLNY